MVLRSETHAAATASRRPAPWTYLWWAATGALVSLGVVSLLTIGIFLLAGAALLVVAGCSLAATRNGGHVGALAGASVAPLYIAWLNRHGPGTFCEPLGVDGTHCGEQWSPWPFLAVGLALLAVAVTVAVRSRRER